MDWRASGKRKIKKKLMIKHSGHPTKATQQQQPQFVGCF